MNKQYTPHIALIIGGSDRMPVHVSSAEKLIERNPYTTFVINDVATIFRDADNWVTLHPEKISRWKHERHMAGFASPPKVWAHAYRTEVTHVFPDDWRGSSGLYATTIALYLGYDKIILCGVELNNRTNIVSGRIWHHADLFKKGWEKKADILKKYVRSYDGWTAELLKEPNIEWLLEPIQPYMNTVPNSYLWEGYSTIKDD